MAFVLPRIRPIDTAFQMEWLPKVGDRKSRLLGGGLGRVQKRTSSTQFEISSKPFVLGHFTYGSCHSMLVSSTPVLKVQITTSSPLGRLFSDLCVSNPPARYRNVTCLPYVSENSLVKMTVLPFGAVAPIQNLPVAFEHTTLAMPRMLSDFNFFGQQGDVIHQQLSASFRPQPVTF
jgi:hypothetical protein